MNRNGFSILELLVVIAVASIVVGIGLPAINNFGVSENYQGDIAVVRSQFNLVRQMAMEDGNAYRIKIVNNDTDNTSELEVYKDESLNRFNSEFLSSAYKKFVLIKTEIIIIKIFFILTNLAYLGTIYSKF